MDVSAEAADLVVKEGLQATETAVKLAGSGIKNVAALLLALSKQDYKVIGQASASRLARDPNPPAVVQIRAEDLSRFRKMAAKQYGVLYLPVRKRGDDSGLITIVSTQTYAANLNCIMEELGYPVPVKEADEPKKAVGRCICRAAQRTTRCARCTPTIPSRPVRRAMTSSAWSWASETVWPACRSLAL